MNTLTYANAIRCLYQADKELRKARDEFARAGDEMSFLRTADLRRDVEALIAEAMQRGTKQE
jgi:hypothetical protein